MKDIQYYAQVSLDTKEYLNLVRIDYNNSYKMTEKSKGWDICKDAQEAPWETDYDELSENQAEKIAASWGVDHDRFFTLPEEIETESKLNIYVGKIPEESKESLRVL